AEAHAEQRPGRGRRAALPPQVALRVGDEVEAVGLEGPAIEVDDLRRRGRRDVGRRRRRGGHRGRRLQDGRRGGEAGGGAGAARGDGRGGGALGLGLRARDGGDQQGEGEQRRER